MKKVNLTALLLFFVLLVSAAEMPDAYYSAANGKSDSILKSSLSQVIRKHTVLSYGSGSNSSWYCFYYADRDPVTGLCMDMYSDDWRSFSSPGSVVSGCNIEHSFAKSWWGGSKNDAYQDCYHLNPSNSTANSSRSNYPLGVPTQELKSNTGSLRVGKATYNGQTFFVFEPKDEYKGDFARAYFYMATCYGDELTWRKDNKDVGSYYAMRNPTDKDAYLEFLDWEIDVLLQWHRQDPVSTKEMNRASAVNDFQKNRNPFIDYPCLAEYIWGNKKGEVVDFSHLMSTANPNYLGGDDKSGCSCEITEPTITSPRKNATVNVGAANLNEELTATINVQGVLLTQNVSLAISGTNASLFKVSKTSLTAAQVLNGVDVVVIYKPTALGQHSATLTLSSGELAASTVVTLTGSCLATLTSPTTQGVSFSGSDATVTQQQDVMIKGTNLAGNVSLTLSGTDAAKFTLTKSSLTAAEVNAGQVIILKYKPEAIKAHTATLTVSSNDFASVVVPITGECTFQALEATNVGSSGFTANWTNAGAANYVLDVSTQTTVGGASVPVLTEQFNGSMSTSVSISGFSILTELNSTAIRIGASGTAATMTLTGLDLSHGASIALSAKMYSATDASTLSLKVGTTTITTWNVTADYSTLTAEIPASAETSLTITSGGTKPRAYIDWLIVSVGGEAITNTSLTGYPKSVGNVQSYLVVGLEPNKQYYYTVTPTGVPVSEQIAVMTLEENTPTSMQYTDANALVYYTTSEAIHILNLQPGSAVKVFDATGRLCVQRVNCLAEEHFDVPSKGVYLIQILSEENHYTIKTLIF